MAVNAALLRINAAHAHLQQTVVACWRRRHAGGMQALRRGVAGLRELRQHYRFGGGVKAEQGDLSKLMLLRAPFFLFLFAEDLSRTFIPAYAAALFTPQPGLSLQFVQALPIVIFMLIVALSQPIVGGWSERIGRRQALLAGALMGALAHLGAAFAFTLYDFLLWRALAGVAWGILFVASQGYLQSAEHRIDVLLVDLGLPDGSGLELIAQCRNFRPEIESMVLSLFGDAESVFNALRAGASGYLLKSNASDNIVAHILDLVAGGSPLSPAVARLVLAHTREFPTDVAKPPLLKSEPLSPRESGVLRLITIGHSYAEIASQMYISIHTVNAHIRNIYRKLRVNSRSEASHIARRTGLLPPDRP